MPAKRRRAADPADRYAPLVEAVQAALAQLRGTYGLAMVFRDWPDVIVAARLGSPLVIGIGDGEHFIASDGSPLVGHTNRIVYLADHELAVVTRNSIRVIHRDEGHVRHNVKQLEIDPTQVELGGFPHYMLKEIFEQPETVVAAMRGRLNRDEATAVFGGLNLTPRQLRHGRPHRAHSVRHELARGAGGRVHDRSLARIPVEVEYASELRYRNPPMTQRHAAVRHHAKRRNDRHAGRASRNEAQGPSHAGDLQRGRQHHCPRGRRRRLPACRAGNRRRVDQGVHVAVRGDGPARALFRPHAAFEL